MIRARGLQLVEAEETRTVRFAAAEEDPANLPAQDVVFVTLKAHAVPGIADQLRELLKPDGHAVFVVNGVPWWWRYGVGDSGYAATPVDPDGRLWERFGPARAVGCVVYSLNEVTSPGTVVHRANNRWILGEPTNQATPRVTATGDLMMAAGLKAEVSTDLRQHVWNKLVRNTPFNPLSALTRLNTDQMGHHPGLVQLAQAVIDEVVHVARAKGWDVAPASAAQVLAAGGALGGARTTGTKPSMLQDVLGGRRMEVDAIVSQVHQFAREENVSTPALDSLLALLRGLDEGLQAGPASAGSGMAAARAA
jgi:2-dehydropantoate 2-reductase